MNRDEKAAVIDEVADRIQNAQAIFAIDYRGLSVKQAVELRQQLGDADAHFQVVKNRLTIRSADKAGAEDLKAFLEGPTALAFVQGDAAVAAKAIATFRRQNGLLEFKGGTLDGDVLSVEQVESIAKLPARDVLHGQFVGVLASPITGLVRGLASMIGGLASQLQQIADQGLVSGEAPAETATEEAPAEEPAPDEEPAATEDAPAEPDADASEPAEEPSEDVSPAEEAPGSPTAEGETGAAEEEASGDAPEGDAQEETADTPAEGDTTDTPSEGDTEQEG